MRVAKVEWNAIIKLNQTLPWTNPMISKQNLHIQQLVFLGEEVSPSLISPPNAQLLEGFHACKRVMYDKATTNMSNNRAHSIKWLVVYDLYFNFINWYTNVSAHSTKVYACTIKNLLAEFISLWSSLWVARIKRKD